MNVGNATSSRQEEQSLTCDWCGLKVDTYMQLKEHEDLHKIIFTATLPNVYSCSERNFSDTKLIQGQKLQLMSSDNSYLIPMEKTSNTDIQLLNNYDTTLQHTVSSNEQPRPNSVPSVIASDIVENTKDPHQIDTYASSIVTSSLNLNGAEEHSVSIQRTWPETPTCIRAESSHTSECKNHHDKSNIIQWGADEDPNNDDFPYTFKQRPKEICQKPSSGNDI